MSIIRSPLVMMVLFFWLVACNFYDLRSLKVPIVMTLIPLGLAGIWRLASGGWLLVLFVACIALISDLPKLWMRLALGVLITCLTILMIGINGSLLPVFVIAFAWFMWVCGASGGADAKIITTIVLLFGQGEMFLPIMLAGGVLGLMGLVTRRKEIPFTLPITAGTLVWLFISH